MYSIAAGNENDLKALFINTANKMGVNNVIVEKDFWVCITLDYLFKKSKWKDALAFKGGTSLSKVYGVIERFSEDIDLILDWRTLGFTKDEPWEVRSNTKMVSFCDDVSRKTKSFLEEEFVRNFKDEMSEYINKTINVYYDDSSESVIFEYPALFDDTYIPSKIRIEIGALASWSPTQLGTIKPYVANYYPNLFEIGETDLLTTTVARTFWEKATILHQEANRPTTSNLTRRYSRHYYDLFCLAKSKYKDEALKEKDLLSQVATFKDKFYHRGWADYKMARIGSLKLIPSEYFKVQLEKDYASMKPMIYGKYYDFNEILKGIANLEEEINNTRII